MIKTGFAEINEERLLYQGVDPWFLEVAITGDCNFHCKYCNRFNADLDFDSFKAWIEKAGLLHRIQITGGEPTLSPRFAEIVNLCREHSISLGISTNGSRPIDLYLNIPADIYYISLDDYDNSILIERGYKNPEHVKNIIKYLSEYYYVSVGVVIDRYNIDRIENILDYILDLGAKDIRLSTSSHYLNLMPTFKKTYDNYPTLAYRVKNFNNKRPMRGFPTKRCEIMKKDLCIVGDKHYPCLVYFREHGQPIGNVGDNILTEREKWFAETDCTKDSICSKFCMDFRCDFNLEVETQANEKLQIKG